MNGVMRTVIGAALCSPLSLLLAPEPTPAQTLMAPAGGGVWIQPVRPGALEQTIQDPAAGELDPAISCPKKLQAAKEDGKALRQEITDLQQQLESYTSRTGSRVTAYCESSTVSRNTAGATSDCAAAGMGCEPVSGLCRTTALMTEHCAPSFLWDATSGRCVRFP
jgi:hypothetical protein